jgi:hypothetical protein
MLAYRILTQISFIIVIDDVSYNSAIKTTEKLTIGNFSFWTLLKSKKYIREVLDIINLIFYKILFVG